MIADIEQAIISRLKTIAQLKSVEIAQGDPIAIIQETVNKRPAARVLFSGSEAEPPQVINSRLTQITLNFTILLVSKRGKGAEDIYDLISLVRGVMQRYIVNDYGFLCLKGEGLIHMQDGVAVYGCEYYIQTSYQ